MMMIPLTCKDRAVYYQMHKSAGPTMKPASGSSQAQKDAALAKAKALAGLPRVDACADFGA